MFQTNTEMEASCHHRKPAIDIPLFAGEAANGTAFAESQQAVKILPYR